MIIDAKNMPYAELNKMIRDSDEQKFTLENVLGQRYIGAGLSGKEILIKGTPGNALGAYLNGAKISVHGNAQDATGDTMNDGAIIIHGNSGDTTGYAMRSGEIYVQGNAGYRVGIHMKSYQDMFPTIVIGGTPIGQKYLQKNLFTNTDPVKITKSKIPPTEHKGFTPGQCPGTIYWPNISHGPCFFQVKTPLHINITK